MAHISSSEIQDSLLTFSVTLDKLLSDSEFLLLQNGDIDNNLAHGTLVGII